MKKILSLLIIPLFLLFPLSVSSAEILQINTIKDIIIGDQNRILSVALSCVEVEKESERLGIEILKRNFPRGTKIKIKPIGFNKSVLSAEVFRIDNKMEMSQILISNDLAKNICN